LRGDAQRQVEAALNHVERRTRDASIQFAARAARTNSPQNASHQPQDLGYRLGTGHIRAYLYWEAPALIAVNPMGLKLRVNPDNTETTLPCLPTDVLPDITH
jgi:hypothetical protein